MTAALVLVFAVAILAASFGIGFWAQKKVTSPEAFLGGSRIFGPFAIGLSTMAAVASAFAIVGVPGATYRFGTTIFLFVMCAPGFALGYLIIGKKLRAIAQLGPVVSLGDVADLRFEGNRGIKALLSIMLFVGCVMYLAAQVTAGAEMFQVLLGIPSIVAAFVIFGVLIVYTILSGEVGGILTQAFQGLIMVVAGLIIVIAFFAEVGGIGAVLESVSAAGTVSGPAGEKTFSPDMLNAWGSLPRSYAVTWVLLPVFGIMCQPQVMIRIMALKSPLDMPRLCVYATVANVLVGFMVVIMGFAALHMVAIGAIPPFERPDEAVFQVAGHLGLIAELFLYSAVLAAALSTSSMFLTLAGTVVSRDFLGALGVHLSTEKQVSVAKASMALLGLLAIGLSASSGQMVAILGTYGFGTLTVATFPVLVIGLLWQRTTGTGALAGLAAALALTSFSIIAEQVSTWRWPGGMPWYVHVLTISIVVTVATSLLTPARSLAPKVRRAMEL
ncbi:MAG: hypothetical protein AAF654_05555 [Myxococcota bacterium]